MLKLINAGFGRTGTTSLQAALEQVGFGPCYHMFDIVGDAQKLAVWEKIVVHGQTPDWADVFDGYTTLVDGPSVVYYPQLMEAFPEAKVILTVRDAESWYQSTYDTLYQFALKAAENASDANSRPARVYRFTSTMVWNGLFDGRFADKDHAIEVYHRHNERVRQTVDPANLLEYEVKQGWEPLCRFLGVDVPDEDFPHANDSASMRKVIQQVSSGAGPVESRP